jgi:hypothetical protein
VSWSLEVGNASQSETRLVRHLTELRDWRAEACQLPTLELVLAGDDEAVVIVAIDGDRATLAARPLGDVRYPSPGFSPSSCARLSSRRPGTRAGETPAPPGESPLNDDRPLVSSVRLEKPRTL